MSGATSDSLFVNDGSTDTAHVRGELMSRGGGWIVALDLPANVGQAGAVQCGIMATLERWTELVGYGDADLSAPLTALGELIEVFGPNPALETVIAARPQGRPGPLMVSSLGGMALVTIEGAGLFGQPGMVLRLLSPVAAAFEQAAQAALSKAR